MVIFTFKLAEEKKCHFCTADNHKLELLPFDTPRKS